MKNIVTIFRTIRATETPHCKDAIFALNRIKSGATREVSIAARNIKDKTERNEFKRNNLSSVCFNGKFRYRDKSGFIEHSGLCILDFDEFENTEHLDACYEYLEKWEYCFSRWLSVSGLGIRALVKIPRCTIDEHKLHFNSIRKHFEDNTPYEDNFDASVGNIVGGCYESYDPDLIINVDSEIWIQSEEPFVEDIGFDKGTNVIFPLTSGTQIIDKLKVWWESKYGMNQGSRNVNLYKFAIALCDFGVYKEDAISYLSQYETKGFNMIEIKKNIDSGYLRGDFGTKEFEDVVSRTKVEKALYSGKNLKSIISDFETEESPEVKKDVQKAIESAVDRLKDNLSITNFWIYVGDNQTIKLVPHQYKFWLQQNKFFKYYPTGKDTYMFIEKDQNLIQETNVSRMKDYVLASLFKRSDLMYGPYNFMAEKSKYFTQEFLSFLDTEEVKLKKDTEHECFLYYKNCIVKTTKNSVSTIDYVDIDESVWKNQIIDRDYVKCDHHQSEYRTFIWRCADGGDEEVPEKRTVDRYNSLKSVIGYFLHSYKTSSNNKAVILNDETISDNPNGGSGKSLISNAFSYMKKVATIDGKQFEFTNSFPYQTVSADTQILVFDDVKRNFPFENLFSLITQGITLEYKGQDALKISVEHSPKILINTNYTIGGIGGSHVRRKHEIEMSAHFNENHTPIDEFGHMLFDDWDNKEWARFDQYMINCVQYYLENGLVECEFNNLNIRKFRNEVSPEFYEWSLEEGSIVFNDRMFKKEKYNDFIENFPHRQKYVTPRKFTGLLIKLAKFKGYDIEEDRQGGERYIMFTDPMAPKPEPTPMVQQTEEATDELPF